jgi:hypothetical protein
VVWQSAAWKAAPQGTAAYKMTKQTLDDLSFKAEALGS